MRYCYIYSKLVDFLEDNKDDKNVKKFLLSLCAQIRKNHFNQKCPGVIALGDFLRSKNLATTNYVRGCINIIGVVEEIERAYA